jgi:hypothetical protein
VGLKLKSCVEFWLRSTLGFEVQISKWIHIFQIKKPILNYFEWNLKIQHLLTSLCELKANIGNWVQNWGLTYSNLNLYSNIYIADNNNKPSTINSKRQIILFLISIVFYNIIVQGIKR